MSLDPESAKARIAALEERVIELEGQVEKLTSAILGQAPMAFMALGLTPHETGILGALMARPETRTKSQLMDALYGLRMTDEEPDQKIIDVFVCRLRRKLKPFGIKIETAWGQGYRLSAEDRQRVLALNTNAKPTQQKDARE